MSVVEKKIQMSVGEKVIGKFNAEDRMDVAEIKSVAARLVDLVQEHGKNTRHNAIAVTHIETAAMFAVKSIFTPDVETQPV